MACLRQSLGSFCVVAACAGVSLFGCSEDALPGGEGGGAGTPAGGSPGSGGSATAGKGGTGGSTGGTGTGGLPGSGGGAGQAGTGGAIGTAGTGGSTATGGTGPSTGGSAGLGGQPGSGGTVSTGGSTGGVAGSGGSTGGTGAGGSSAGAAGSAGSGGTGGTPNNCPVQTPQTGGRQVCMNQRGNAAGTYTYELWAEGGGMGCMNVYGVDATFRANWSNVEDFLARVGLDFDRTRTPAEIGNITAEFAHTKTGSEEGLTYIGIYGWTVNPLREYYILDDWGTEKPAGVASDGTPRTSVGTLTADGETYDVWMKTRMNKPAITGDNMTFDQYFSIRRTARQCGTISVSEHFDAWVEMGLPLGDLVEVKLLLEAQFNSGTAEFTTARFVVD